MTIKLLFCTSNEYKRKEVERILNEGGTQYEVIPTHLDIPELQGTIKEVAASKCLWAYNHLKQEGEGDLPEDTFVMTEDTGLAFDALNGLPGPYIKWFLQALRNEGLPRLLDGFADYGAAAQDAIAIYNHTLERPLVFLGAVRGKIVDPRGPQDFGWDANFLPDGETGTYAELPKGRKDEISHRRRALDALRAYFNS